MSRDPSPQETAVTRALLDREPVRNAMTDLLNTNPQAAFGALKYEVDAYLWRVAQFSAGWIDKRTLLDAGSDLMLAMERMEQAMNGVKR